MKLYFVRNQDKQFLRAKGYQGSGQCWVKDIDDAKVYTKLGTARRQVTFWASNYPKFGIPDLLEITIDLSQAVVLNEADRVQKQKIKKQKEIELRKIRHNEWEKSRLQLQIDEAKCRLEQIR